jgi:hypothetical protein
MLNGDERGVEAASQKSHEPSKPADWETSAERVDQSLVGGYEFNPRGDG